MNDMSISIYEFFHYSFFPGLFIAFTYNKKEPPAFGAAPAFWFLLFSFFGLLFCHIENNLSNYNVLTANAPFFYQISGTWSNHEGSLLLWCRIPTFFGFLLSYRGRSQSHNVSKRGGPSSSLLFSFVLNFVQNSILHRDRSRKMSFRPERKMSFRTTFALLAARKRGSREGKRMSPLLHLARDEKERASSIDEQRIDGAWYLKSIVFFFFPFLSASSDPFVRNFFVRTEPLAESNPVPQDPISAIHPPCLYAGYVASAVGFALCRSKMMNGIVALYSPPMRKGAAFSKNGTLLCSAGCVGSRITSELFSLKLKFKHEFKDKESGKKETTTFTSPLCWTAGANTVVSDQDQEALRIWILTCRCFLTVGILPGSWWAHHELGRGGWWFRDPVENASFMPRVLATARLHSVILPHPILNSWTLLLNLVTFLCCVLGTFSIRSGLLAPVHSFATDETRGIFLWWFFLIMTGISMILFSQMQQQASVRRTYQKEMVVARSSLVHLRHLARAQPLNLKL